MRMEYENIIATYQLDNYARDLVNYLFTHNFVYNSVASLSRNEQRVRNRESFDTYFRFQLPYNAVSSSDLAIFKQVLADRKKLAAFLFEFAQARDRQGVPRLTRLLRRVFDYPREFIE